MRLFNAIKAKVGLSKATKKGCMYVEVKVRNFNTRALVDTGASHNFIKVKKAKRLGLQFKEDQGWLKSKETSTQGGGGCQDSGHGALLYCSPEVTKETSTREGGGSLH